MAQRSPLTITQRESIYRDKLSGCHLKASAKEQECSYSCARKWWRVGRDQGLEGLRWTSRSRSATIVLSTFEPVIAERALYWKHQHPKRGPISILQDMKDDAYLVGLHLPQRSTLALFFQQTCPELLQHRERQAEPPEHPCRVHERWQMDSKESIRLQDGTVATVLDLREPVACIFLGSFAHAVQTAKGWRKLTLRETQADLRSVFTEFGLPAGIQTDREQLYGQPAKEAFPSVFTLWLVGLGMEHHLGRPHQPTDQPQVERGHRTLFDWMEQPEPSPDLKALQTDLDTARHMHNAVLPSEAGDCHGHIPLQVHPEVLQMRRPYHPSAELELFSLARVDHFLSQFTWQHKVSAVGQASVQGHHYGIGTAHAGKTVDVRFDPVERHLVFSDAQSGQELKRCQVHGLDVTTITGLEVPLPSCQQALQLSFAF